MPYQSAENIPPLREMTKHRRSDQAETNSEYF